MQTSRTATTLDGHRHIRGGLVLRVGEVDAARGFGGGLRDDVTRRGVHVGGVFEQVADAVAVGVGGEHLSMGFFLNIINPANFLEWVGTASVLKTKYHFETFENASFFVGALLAVFGTELFVAYFASRLRRVLSNRLMYRINMVSGLVFIGSGVWLLWEAMK